MEVVYYPWAFTLSGDDYTGLSSVCQQWSDERQWIGRRRTVKVNMRFMQCVYYTTNTITLHGYYANYSLIKKIPL